MIEPMMLLALMAAVGFVKPQAPSDSVAGPSLEDVYGTTLVAEPGAPGVPWSTGPEDVWRLGSFHFEVEGGIRLETGAATLVVGRHAGGAEREGALWAVLLPDKPAPIATALPGGGEGARSVFLRFAPSSIGGLFPAAIVQGRGDAMALVRAKRIVAHKTGSSFQRGGAPFVPREDVTVLDVGTVEGKRRFYLVTGKDRAVKFEPAFADRALPALGADGLEPNEGRRVFGRAWGLFDQAYPYFALKDVDWEDLRDRYGALAERARSPEELAGVIGLLVTELEDLHAWVKFGSAIVPTDHGVRITNGNFRAIRPKLEDVRQRGQVVSGRLRDGVGYILVDSLTGDSLLADFDASLETLKESPGLVLDLRFNGGGDERLGKGIAGRFLRERVPYGSHRYRSGAGHDEFGDAQLRTCEPRGPWRYRNPVVVLQGAMIMSSGEALVQMLIGAPNVTTMGAHTAGSSANPQAHDIGYGIVVSVPRWLNMDAEGRPLEGIGVAPRIQAKATRAADFGRADPLFDQAVAWLRDKIDGPR